MLVWLTLPFYDFCGFRSVAVNSVYKLQFFTFISGKTRAISGVVAICYVLPVLWMTMIFFLYSGPYNGMNFAMKDRFRLNLIFTATSDKA